MTAWKVTVKCHPSHGEFRSLAFFSNDSVLETCSTLNCWERYVNILKEIYLGSQSIHLGKPKTSFTFRLMQLLFSNKFLQNTIQYFFRQKFALSLSFNR